MAPVHSRSLHLSPLGNQPEIHQPAASLNQQPTITDVDLLKDSETATLMKQHVSPNTRKSYEASNTKLIIYLFDEHDKYPTLLCDTFYALFKQADKEDKARRTRSGRPSRDESHSEK